MIDRHWAVQAVGDDCLARAWRTAAGHGTDGDSVWQAAMAYEIAAIEGLDAAIHPEKADEEMLAQVREGAALAYALRRTLAVPTEPEDRAIHVLHLAALACCGGQLDSLRRWLEEHKLWTSMPLPDGDSWGLYMLCRLCDCWMQLLSGRGDDAIATIAKLREDQKRCEGEVGSAAWALRLAALYHLAKATELLALHGVVAAPHFDASWKAASVAQDIKLGSVIKWLHAAASMMGAKRELR